MAESHKLCRKVALLVIIGLKPQVCHPKLEDHKLDTGNGST